MPKPRQMEFIDPRSASHYVTRNKNTLVTDVRTDQPYDLALKFTQAHTT